MCVPSPRPPAESPLPCNAAFAPNPAHRPLSPPVQQLTLASYAHLATRQDADAFNQPLGFDTSKVTSTFRMFSVRALAPTSCRALP